MEPWTDDVLLMQTSIFIILASTAAALFYEEGKDLEKGLKRSMKRKHKLWMKKWRRERLSRMPNTAYKLQMQLLEQDAEEFQHALRMPPALYLHLLERIGPMIKMRDTSFRPAITPEERLSLTLKYLATGESPTSLSHAYRIGRCTVGRIIKQVCRVIYQELGPEYIKTPKTPEGWTDITKQFWDRWHYPGCLGAVDGKHIAIMRPPLAGSDFYNYKGFHSIVLMAIVNSNYEFIYVDVGSEGRVADGGIWKDTDIFQHIERGIIQLPPDYVLQGCTERITPHFVADDAFAMSPRVLKPYAHRQLSDREAIYNYRLSRARRIVENVFGILASRFTVFRKNIMMNPDSAQDVVLAACTLHNMLRVHNGRSYMPVGSVDHEDQNHEIQPGSWREEHAIPQVRPTDCRNPTNEAKSMRNRIADYFMTDQGSVAWQGQHLSNTLENTMINMRRMEASNDI